MPSLRSMASSAPRSPVASAASAALSSRSFSDAANRRRFFGGVLSTDAPLTARSRCLRSLSEGGIQGSRIGEGLGTYEEPFSAYQYRYIQRELSHVTLAERARVRELAAVCGHRGDNTGQAGQCRRVDRESSTAIRLQSAGRLLRVVSVVKESILLTFCLVLKK